VARDLDCRDRGEDSDYRVRTDEQPQPAPWADRRGLDGIDDDAVIILIVDRPASCLSIKI
jgi:hypothetical protein